MRIKSFSLIAALLISIIPAHAQTGSSKTATQLNTEANTKFIDQNIGQITPYDLRQMTLDMIASYPNLNGGQYVQLANGGLGGSQLAATANQVPVFPGTAGAAVPTTITPSIIGSLGTGIATALGVNIGTAGSPVVNGGALGTPSSVTLTNATGLPAAGVTGTAATLTVADQTLSGGANVTPANLGTKSSGTTTIDCGTAPLQYLTNGGAFTLAAPSNDGSCIIQVTNNGSAGAITFSGFTVSSSTGAALTTTNTNKFMISIARINGSSIYTTTAQQ